MEQQDNVFFREVQRFNSIWVWVLVLLIAGLMWYITIKQIIFGTPMGDNPAPDVLLILFWVAFGVLFPVFMLWMCRLIIEVRSDGIYIRFAPFHNRFKPFLFKDIIGYKPVVYHSLQRFGGWGVRFNAKGETAYNISGNQGMKLQLKHNTIIVGTQKLDELKEAMDSVQKHIKS